MHIEMPLYKEIHAIKTTDELDNIQMGEQEAYDN